MPENACHEKRQKIKKIKLLLIHSDSQPQNVCIFPQSIVQLSQISLMHVCILNKYVAYIV